MTPSIRIELLDGNGVNVTGCPIYEPQASAAIEAARYAYERFISGLEEDTDDIYRRLSRALAEDE